MGEQTKIEWTDHTFSAWIGCEKISPGCKHCYASVDTYARVSKSRGLPLWGPGSSRHVTSRSNWRKPIAWNREAERSGIRRRVFCSSLSDVFEDREDLREPRARLWRLIEATPSLDWLLLTKRPEHAVRLASLAARDADAFCWLPNIWLGTTCEDQKHADERLPHLLAVPAAVRFVSYEPALGRVDFRPFFGAGDVAFKAGRAVNWMIVGGESGPGARVFDLEWARTAIAQCKAAGVPAFCKQLGSRPIDNGVALKLKHPKGGAIEEWPAGDWPREWPDAARS